MGGFFSAPSPPPPPPEPPPAPDPADEERKRRLEALERRRRGRTGMIQTSDRGLLSTNAADSSQKTLLGE